jgi:hypothetical protein
MRSSYRSAFIATALAVALGGCAEQQPEEPAAEAAGMNLLGNGEFSTAHKGNTPVFDGTINPWMSDSSHAELRADAGFDGKPGYLRAAGGGIDMMYMGQYLQAPLAEGRRYMVEAAMRFRPQDSPGIDHGIVTFAAVSSAGSGGQTPAPDGTIGVARVAASSWNRYTLGPWKAGIGYQRFVIVVENEASGHGGVANRSVVDIDDVRLVEVQ